MLDFLYAIFIAPLEWGMCFVLEHAYTWTDSYGAAIIILSLVVNTVLLPLYNKADAWQQEDRAKQAKMADKIAELKLAFKGQERFMMLKTLYRQNHYHPIMAARNSIGFLIQVPFFFAAYQLLSHYDALNGQAFGPFADLGVADALVNIGDYQINLMPFVMTVINLLSAFIYTKGLTSRDKIQLYAFAGVFLVLLYTSPVGLVLYWTLNNIYSLCKNIVSKLILKYNKVLSFDFNFNSKVFLVRKIIPDLGSKTIFFSSLYIICILVLVYIPVKIFNSDPVFFHITLNDLLFHSVTSLISFFIIISLFYFCLNNRFKGKATFFINLIAFICLFNVFVPLRDYGEIDSYFLTNGSALGGRKLLLIYDLLIVFLIYLLLVYLVVKKNLQSSKMIYPLVAIVISIYTIFLFISGDDIAIEKEIVKNTSTDLLPDYNHVLNSYSKNEKNVVVIMLDMFTGDHVNKIFNDYPEIKKDYHGFIWYPNTITNGNATFVSEPSIHGGHNYTVDKINKRSDEIDSIVDEIAKAYIVFNDNFGRNGFDISLYGTQFVNCDLISKYVNNQYLKLCRELGSESDYFNYHTKKENVDISSYEGDDNKFLQTYALMSVSPYIFRPYIYQNGQWLGTVSRFFSKKMYGKHSHLASLDSISNIESPKPTFKYIQNEIAHIGWYINKDLSMTTDDPYPQTEGQLTKVDGIIPEHLYAEAYSLKEIGDWIKWLKKNNIFDNTKIVLVSDHGEGDSVSLSESFDVNVKGQSLFGTNQGYPGRPHGLLMVKDFNNSSEFSISDTFMSTADVPSIVCEVINGCFGIEPDPRYSNSIRKLQHSVIDKPWPDAHPLNSYSEVSRYEVTGSIFDKENWKQIK